MRGRAAGGIASATLVVGCTLGVVDLQPEPAPAELLVVSEVEAEPTDPSRVRVMVRATLDPGIGFDGTPRHVVSDVLGVEDSFLSASEEGDPPLPTWLASESYTTPGPEAVLLRLPRVEGLGLGETINMRVRVDVTPGGAIVLGDGEDLVLNAEPPSNPAQTLEWSLELTSASRPTFRLRAGGTESWPDEVRIPAERIPRDALPLEALLRIQWDRSLSLFEVTATERYDLALRSIMVVAWTVEATP